MIRHEGSLDSDPGVDAIDVAGAGASEPSIPAAAVETGDHDGRRAVQRGTALTFDDLPEGFVPI